LYICYSRSSRSATPSPFSSQTATSVRSASRPMINSSRRENIGLTWSRCWPSYLHALSRPSWFVFVVLTSCIGLSPLLDALLVALTAPHLTRDGARSEHHAVCMLQPVLCTMMRTPIMAVPTATLHPHRHHAGQFTERVPPNGEERGFFSSPCQVGLPSTGRQISASSIQTLRQNKYSLIHSLTHSHPLSRSIHVDRDKGHR